MLRRASAYAQAVRSDSPLLYWRLNEAVGTNAADSSGNGRTGTYTAAGITYNQAGAVAGGAAILTSGTGGQNCVQSTAALDLSPYSAITIEMFGSVPSYPGGDLIFAELSGNYSVTNGCFVIDPNAGSVFNVAMFGASGLNSVTFARPTAAAFHHYVFILRTATTTGAITARVDKVAQTMTESATNSLSAFASAQKLNFTSRGNGSVLNIAGTFQELAIYGSALSTARTDAHYDARNG